jgi:hypothetical protein
MNGDLDAAVYRHQMNGDLDAAVEHYRRSIEFYPTAEAHTFLGWAYSFQKRGSTTKPSPGSRRPWKPNDTNPDTIPTST